MSKKYQYPRSKVRARPDVKSMEATVPEAIIKQLHVRAGDSLEWIVTSSGNENYVKVNVIRDQG
jgi:hypothetical protein